MKKSIISVVCILSMLIAFMGNGTVAYAQEAEIKKEETVVSSEKKVPISAAEVAEGVISLEQELTSKGTDVVTELEKQIEYYQGLLNSLNTQEQSEQIESLVFTTQELITEYQEYSNSEQTRGDFHLVYTPAVATVIAYFNSNNYNLAAELLTHARDNDNLDSIYTPVNRVMC